MAARAITNTCWVVFLVVVMGGLTLVECIKSSQISLGSRLLASQSQEVWVSDNGTFAFGFTATQTDNNNKRLFLLAIWFARLPGDPTLVWSPNRYITIYYESTNILVHAIMYK